VPLTVAVAPDTPPGEYRAELKIAGRSRPVVLCVVEVFELQVLPQTLVVLNVAGRPQQRRVMVSNRGNVVCALGGIGEVDLENDVTADRAARMALEPWSEIVGKDGDGPVLALIKIAAFCALRGCKPPLQNSKLHKTAKAAPPRWGQPVKDYGLVFGAEIFCLSSTAKSK
jgi:hypothetical protein